MGNLAFVLLAILPLLSLSDACSCMIAHPQQAFCDADFVIRAGVLSNMKAINDTPSSYGDYYYGPTFAYYDILIAHVFKGREKIEELFGNGKISTINPMKRYRAKIHTAYSGAACGIALGRGEKYVLSGKIMDNKLMVYSCNWHEQWYKVEKGVRHGIHGAYECDCKIQPYFGNKADASQACSWQLTWDYWLDKCVSNQQMCKRKNNICQWHQLTALTCEKESATMFP